MLAPQVDFDEKLFTIFARNFGMASYQLDPAHQNDEDELKMEKRRNSS